MIKLINEMTLSYTSFRISSLSGGKKSNKNLYCVEKYSVINRQVNSSTNVAVLCIFSVSVLLLFLKPSFSFTFLTRSNELSLK